MNIFMKLFYQYMAILFTFSLTSNHLHPLQVENCDSNSRLVVDEDDNGKFRLERVNQASSITVGMLLNIVKAFFCRPHHSPQRIDQKSVLLSL